MLSSKDEGTKAQRNGIICPWSQVGKPAPERRVPFAKAHCLNPHAVLPLLLFPCEAAAPPLSAQKAEVREGIEWGGAGVGVKHERDKVDVGGSSREVSPSYIRGLVSSRQRAFLLF